MKFKLLIIFSVGVLLFSFTNPSNIRILNFNQFEPNLHLSNDTTYVINFWATWCPPCRKELPAFEKLNKAYHNKPVKVVLVSLDFPNQIKSSLIPFIEKNKLKSEVLLLNDPDANAWIDKVNKSWSGSIPATLVYNKDKRIFNEGSLTYTKLDSIVNQIMIMP
jgi:thiol-disulfide isomerase/thioredoxin